MATLRAHETNGLGMRCPPKIEYQQVQWFVGSHFHLEAQADKARYLQAAPMQKRGMDLQDESAQRLHLHDKPGHTGFHLERHAPQWLESKCCVLAKDKQRQCSLRTVALHLLGQVLVLIVRLRWPNEGGWLAAGVVQTNHAET